MEVLERRLIGALALSPDLIGEYDGRITPELFTDGVCRDLWVAMAAAHKERGGFEITDVPANLQESYVAISLEESAGEDPGRLVAVLEDATTKRRIEDLCRRAFHDAAGDAPGATVLERLQADLAAIPASYGVLPGLDLDAYRVEMKTDPEGYHLGFSDLDKYVRLLPGGLCFVAARTTQGKTTFLINAALNILKNSAAPVLFFNLEVRDVDLITTLITTLQGRDGVSYDKVRSYFRGALNDEEAKERVEAAFADLAGYTSRLHTISRDGLAAPDIARMIGAAARLYDKPPVVFVDYVQLVAPPVRRDQRYLELADVSQILLDAAKRHSATVIAAVQAGRTAGDEMPTLEKLRESGNLEQDAAVVLGLYSPPDKDEYRESIDVKVLKNRYGQAGGEVVLSYRKPQRFMEDAENARAAGR